MKIQKYKKSFSIALVLTLLLVSSIVFSYGNELPITQNPVSQSKNAGLAINKLVVGNLDSPQKLARATSSGWLGLGLPISGSLTNPTVPLDVRGAIRLSELKEPSRQVCASKDGDILDCGFQEFSYGENCVPSTCSQASSIHKFTVPTGVTSITVELWGAGAMGYYSDTYNHGNSPDNSTNCVYNQNSYQCPSGGSSYLYDANGSSTVLARAYGGQDASTTTAGGTGGSTHIPVNSKVSTIASASGSNGGVGGNGEPADPNFSLYCNPNTYTLLYGGKGGIGGKGGSSGSGGASILGPTGGFPGALINCQSSSPYYGGRPFKGNNGYDGIRGSGGSGASGHGGSAYEDFAATYCYNNNCLSSENGYPGGGGGGYVKVFVSPVKPGDVYTVKLSHGGEIDAYVSNSQDLPCDYFVKWTCFQEVKSGKGGPGFARISY